MININESKRLTFELASEKDVDLLYQLDQDKEVMRYINGGIKTSKQEIVDVYLPRMKCYTNPEKGWGIWKVFLLGKDSFIGWVLVRPYGFFSDDMDETNLELGWRFARKYWGNGYATEAARQVKQALIDAKVAQKLSAIVIKENLASIGVMKKLGMEYIKENTHIDPILNKEVIYFEMKIE